MSIRQWSMVVVSLFIGLGVLPYGIGLWMQSQFQTTVATPNAVYKIKQYSFHRGWFSSEATLEVEVTQPDIHKLWQTFFPEQASIPLQFTIDQSIQHMPFGIVTNRFTLSSALASALSLAEDTEWYVHLNHRQDKHLFWVGDVQISAPKLALEKAGEPFFVLEDYHFNTEIEEHHQQWGATESVSIKQMLFNGEPLGLLSARLSMQGLSVADTSNLLTQVSTILQQGEKYGSQLRVKMSLMLPLLLTPNTLLRIDKLLLKTPKGNLTLKAEVNWQDAASAATNFLELARSAHLQAQLHIAKPLFDQLLHIAGQSPYFYEITPEERIELISSDKDINAAIKRNILSMTGLVENRQITEAVAENLLQLQNQNGSSEEYYQMIQQGFLKKDVTLYASYLLGMQYAAVQQLITELNHRVEAIQTTAENKMRAQWMEWVKQGLITQNESDYVVSLTRAQGSVFLNGKAIAARH